MFFYPLGEDEDLGPPPSVDEAADALMTRLGFLLGDKIVTGEAGSSYQGQDDGQVISKCELELNSVSVCRDGFSTKVLL